MWFFEIISPWFYILQTKCNCIEFMTCCCYREVLKEMLSHTKGSTEIALNLLWTCTVHSLIISTWLSQLLKIKMFNLFWPLVLCAFYSCVLPYRYIVWDLIVNFLLFVGCSYNRASAWTGKILHSRMDSTTEYQRKVWLLSWHRSNTRKMRTTWLCLGCKQQLFS